MPPPLMPRSSKYAPPLMAVRFVADLCLSIRGEVRSLHMAKLQATSVPIAQRSYTPKAAIDQGTDRRIKVTLTAIPP